MTETTYPCSLRQALAYLEVKPLVRMTAIFADRVCQSQWWYVGQRRGAIWFEPFGAKQKYRGFDVAQCGIELTNSEFEVGLEFDRRGFQYSRGAIRVSIDYVNPLEALK